MNLHKYSTLGFTIIFALLAIWQGFLFIWNIFWMINGYSGIQALLLFGFLFIINGLLAFLGYKYYKTNSAKTYLITLGILMISIGLMAWSKIINSRGFYDLIFQSAGNTWFNLGISIYIIFGLIALISGLIPREK